MRVIDLCSGTGAFTLASEATGFEVVYANDMDPSSEIAHKTNFPKSNFVLGDVNEVDPTSIPDHDLLLAGFPCQGFSLAGKKLGFEDERSNVFWTICDILKVKQPAYFILENVKNLLTHDDGKTFERVLTALRECGYQVKHAVFDTRTVTDLPQHRERVYMVGFRSQERANTFTLELPRVANRPLSDFLEKKVPEKYYYTEKLKVYPAVVEAVVSPGIVYQYRRTFVRANKSGVCPTLTANMGGGGHNVPLILDNGRVRKLTPRECFSLQGFPSDYKLPRISDSKLYKLAGNAVSVPVVKAILELLIQT
jgi:DNA (cytosine-5)-methyltransferase 1